MLVRTSTDDKHKGLSVLLIPNNTPGMVINKLPTLSRHATGTTEIFLDEVRVPGDALLGEEGQGWKIITEHLELERCAVAAAYTGNAQQAVTTATRYAHDRIQFDHQLYDFGDSPPARRLPDEGRRGAPALLSRGADGGGPCAVQPRGVDGEAVWVRRR